MSCSSPALAADWNSAYLAPLCHAAFHVNHVGPFGLSGFGEEGDLLFLLCFVLLLILRKLGAREINKKQSQISDNHDSYPTRLIILLRWSCSIFCLHSSSWGSPNILSFSDSLIREGNEERSLFEVYTSVYVGKQRNQDRTSMPFVFGE